MCRGIWTKKQSALPFSGFPKMVEHASRLHMSEPSLGVDPHHTMHVLGEINHDGYVATLPSQARSASARENRRTVFACKPHGSHHIIRMPRYDDAYRHLAVIGAVRSIEGTSNFIEPNRAFYRFCESPRQ